VNKLDSSQTRAKHEKDARQVVGEKEQGREKKNPGDEQALSEFNNEILVHERRNIIDTKVKKDNSVQDNKKEVGQGVGKQEE